MESCLPHYINFYEGSIHPYAFQKTTFIEPILFVENGKKCYKASLLFNGSTLT